MSGTVRSAKGQISHDKSLVLKFGEKEGGKDSSSKPCIDFQPDERWHIKDEKEMDRSPENVPAGRVTRRSARNSSKSSAMNGESSQISDSDDHISSSKTRRNRSVENSEDKAKCNNSKSSSKKDAEVVKNNGETKNNDSSNSRSKRKCTSNNSNDAGRKKTKLDKVEEENADTRSSGQGDDSSEKMEVDKSSEKMEVDKSSDKVEVNKSSDKMETDKSKEERKTEESCKKAKPISSAVEGKKVDAKDDSTAEKDAPEKQNEPMSAPVLEKECSIGEELSSTSEEIAADEAKNMPELSSENSSNSSKKDDAEISIIEEKRVYDVDSDNEIEIISSTSKETKKEYVEPFTNYNKSFTEQELLSADFPYFKCLKERIKDLKAGEYKPIKFPHSGNILLDDKEVLVESPSLLVPLLIKEPDAFPTLTEEEKKENTEEVPKPAFRKNFFQSSVGQFLINLGSSRVLEWYHRAMKHEKCKGLKKAGGSDSKIEEAIEMHKKRFEEVKAANTAFNFRLLRCQFCDFKTESQLVLDSHYLTPHMTPRREYKCNYCTYITRDPRDIVFHFEAVHEKKASLENQMILHECLFCAFQSHLKSKVTIHMNRCRKNFISAQNQSPPFDFEFPGVTTKPVTYNDVVAHRKRVMYPKGTALPGNSLTGSLTLESLAQSAFARKKLASVLSLTGAEGFPDSPTLVKHLMGQQGKTAGGFQLPPGIVITRPRVRGQQPRSMVSSVPQPRLPGIRQPGTARNTAIAYPSGIPSQFTSSSGISITPISKGDTTAQRLLVTTGMKNITLTPVSSAGNQVVSQKPGPPQPVALFSNVAGTEASRNRTGVVSQSLKVAPNTIGKGTKLIPPYQRLNTPPSQVVKNSSGSTFVMCEICDSYIKDLEELRSHMNWIHKVKIHPKMLVSRPPLNCQKCQWRFFTDQGLERHLLGAHGLVTTNMQEMANKNQDGGRCIICGAVFTYKLVSHMTQVHKVTLKPAHLSYKCTVCTATFTLYRLFESHVYNVHSGSSKKAENSASADKSAAVVVAKKATEDADSSSSEERKISPTTKCKACNFITDRMDDHIIKKHMKECSVKLCHIEKCEKCLYSSGEILLIRMSDFQVNNGESSSEDSGSSEEDSSSDDEGDNSDSSVKVGKILD